METKEVAEFINGTAIIDVRSPLEFAQGHIPTAFNLPIFDNEGRAIVGTLYKQSGKDFAVEKGLAIVGPKMADFVTVSKSKAQDKKIFLHCWRGGMRSSSFAWLLETAALKPSILRGGYKNYRKFVLDFLNDLTLKIIVLGGNTGSGKTAILLQLRTLGQQVIDLEGLANHKGSAFGALGQLDQPTNEQFENNLVYELSKLDLSKPVWIEAESRLIGKITIPAGLWKNLKNGERINVQVDLRQRVHRIAIEYGNMPIADLVSCIRKIENRLGNEHTTQAVEALEQGDLEGCIGLCMLYYDKYYALSAHDWTPTKVRDFKIEDTEAVDYESLINVSKSIYGTY